MTVTMPLSSSVSIEDMSTPLMPVEKFDHIVSDKMRIIFQWVFYVVLCQLVAVFGIIANIINIVCFVKQGFNDPVTISLLGLAISDLGCLVPLVWTNICYNPAFNDLDLTFEPIEMQYLTGAWPHSTFARVTSWITAFITLERCLCITVPLKVKTLITPKRITVAIIVLFIVLLASTCPLYYANRYANKYSPTRNKTIIGLVFTDDRGQVELVSFAINNILIPGSAFIVVIVCTITLIVNLKMKAKWRKKSMSSGNVDASSKRDQKVTKMITVISTLFIACYLPICTIIVALLVEPDMSIDGTHRNTLIAVCGVGFFLESANSASNIFIYYFMSSRYRSVFRQVFICCRETVDS